MDFENGGKVKVVLTWISQLNFSVRDVEEKGYLLIDDRAIDLSNASSLLSFFSCIFCLFQAYPWQVSKFLICQDFLQIQWWFRLVDFWSVEHLSDTIPYVNC